MTAEDLRAIALSIVEKLAERPAEAAIIVSIVLSEILAIGLFAGELDESIDFAAAVNSRLREISLRHGADRGWQLVPTQPPRRH